MALDGSLVGRRSFKVFNQDFIVDERYTVTKELGQGAYGIVWYVVVVVAIAVAVVANGPTVLRPIQQTGRA